MSPKNLLVGPDGPVLLDAECAWYGDPAFDPEPFSAGDFAAWQARLRSEVAQTLDLLEARAGALGVLNHRAQLRDPERPPHPTHALLAEEDRPRRGEGHRDADEDRDADHLRRGRCRHRHSPR